MTFLLTVDDSNLESIFKIALASEIAKSGLTKQPVVDTVDLNFSTYIGSFDKVTTALWYIMHEHIPLTDFICVAIDNSHDPSQPVLVSLGTGYGTRVFNPHIMFDEGVFRILPRQSYHLSI